MGKLQFSVGGNTAIRWLGGATPHIFKKSLISALTIYLVMGPGAWAEVEDYQLAREMESEKEVK